MKNLVLRLLKEKLSSIRWVLAKKIKKRLRETFILAHPIIFIIDLV